MGFNQISNNILSPSIIYPQTQNLSALLYHLPTHTHGTPPNNSWIEESEGKILAPNPPHTVITGTYTFLINVEKPLYDVRFSGGEHG